jgi:hypothetical protein
MESFCLKTSSNKKKQQQQQQQQQLGDAVLVGEPFQA